MKTKNIIIILFVGLAIFCLSHGAPKSVSAVPPGGCVVVDSSQNTNYLEPKLDEETCYYTCTVDENNGTYRCLFGGEEILPH